MKILTKKFVFTKISNGSQGDSQDCGEDSIILLADRNIQKRNNRYVNILQAISGKIGL